MSLSSSRWAPVWVALAVLAAQLPALAGGFVWDDVPLLVASDLYTAPGRLGEALIHPLGMATAYWRPVATTSFLFDANVLGGSAAAFRGTAAVLHALTAALVVVGVRRAGFGVWPAVAAGLLFGWHPVTVEPVTWISGRFDVLAGLGAAAALAVVLGDPNGSRRTTALVALATAFAALSKEGAFVLPLVLAAVAMARGGGRRGALRIGLGSAAGVLIVLGLRLLALGDLPTSPDVAGAALGGPLERLLLVGRVVAEQFSILFMPWIGVGPGHHAPLPVEATDVLAWTGLAAVLLAMLVAVRATRIAPSVGDDAKWAHVPAWWMVAVAVALAPVSQVLPLDLGGDLITADRFLYLPLLVGTIGLCCCVSDRDPECSGPSRHPRQWIGLALVLLALVAHRVARIGDWKDDRALFTRMAEMAPDSPLPWLGLYEVESRSGGRTVEIAATLVERWPTRGYTALLAQAHLDRGEVEQAREVLLAAPPMDPPHAEFLVMEGESLLALGHPEYAEARYATAIGVVRGTEAGRFTRLVLRVLAGGAVSARRSGDRSLAHARLDAALTIARERPRLVGRSLALLAALELERVEDGLGLVEPGVPLREAWYVAALEAAGRARVDADAVDRLVGHGDAAPERRRDRLDAVGRGLGAVGDWQRAADVYRRLVESSPENAAYRDHLGYVLFGAGDPEGAERELRIAIDLDPEHAWAHYHLGLLLDRTERSEDADRAYANARSLALSTNDRALLTLLDAVRR